MRLLRVDMGRPGKGLGAAHRVVWLAPQRAAPNGCSTAGGGGQGARPERVRGGDPESDLSEVWVELQRRAGETAAATASVRGLVDVSSKRVLFYDASASYTHVAQAVVDQFAAVKYFCPWERGFSVARDFLPGIGLGGVERVADFFTALDDIDLVVFTDVGSAGLQEYLREQGLPVFGSARGAELERDRWKLKRTLEAANIDVSDGYLVRGLDNLRKVLQKQDDLWIKFSYFRGNVETFHHRSYPMSTHKLAEWALSLGPYAEVAEFIVEPPIESGLCVEVGCDPPWTCDGRFPQTFLWGYEDKDAAYCGTTHALPARMSAVLEKLAPILGKYGYRGPLSTETRECDDRASYLIDLSCRFPEPPSSVHTYLATNWGEMMYCAAIGDPVEPEYAGSYAVEIVLRSEAGAEHPLAVDIGNKDRVRLHGHCRINGQDYAVSPSEIREFGAACGIGDSLADATEEALDAAESVTGDEVEFDAAAVRRLLDTIRDGQKLDLDWGTMRGAEDAATQSSR